MSGGSVHVNALCESPKWSRARTIRLSGPTFVSWGMKGRQICVPVLQNTDFALLPELCLFVSPWATPQLVDFLCSGKALRLVGAYARDGLHAMSTWWVLADRAKTQIRLRRQCCEYERKTSRLFTLEAIKKEKKKSQYHADIWRRRNCRVLFVFVQSICEVRKNRAEGKGRRPGPGGDRVAHQVSLDRPTQTKKREKYLNKKKDGEISDLNRIERSWCRSNWILTGRRSCPVGLSGFIYLTDHTLSPTSHIIR